MKKGWFDKVLRILLIVVLIITFFRLSPAAILVEEREVRTVVVSPSTEIRYFPEDGSFLVGPIAGCLRWHSCGINEPTDWWVVLR